MTNIESVPVVLFTNSWLMGGMEAHVLDLGRGLVGRGFPVAAICSPSDEIRPLRQWLAEAGVQVHGLAEREGSPLGTARRLRALMQTLRRYPRCILHLHLGGYDGADLVLLAGQLAGARAILRTEHAPPVGRITARARALVQLRDHFLSRIIWVSEQNRRDHLTQLGRDPHKSIVVPNCVDLERFSPQVDAHGIHAELGLDPAAPIVGTVSRLSEERKGITYFLEMAAVVAQAYPRAQFVVVGEGMLRPELERQAAALGLASRMIFTGARPDIPRLLAAMQVFVLPSLWEGCPYSVLEALAMAKPVVATPVAADVVADQVTGLVVPIADSAALAQGVLKLLADETLARRLGQRGHELMAARFSLNVMVDSIASVYREVA